MLADDLSLVLHREALAPVSALEARGDDLRTPLQTALLVREQRSVSAMSAPVLPQEGGAAVAPVRLHPSG